MKEHELLLWMTSKDIDGNSLSLETEGKMFPMMQNQYPPTSHY